MSVTLQPILHKETYTALVEHELVEYVRETVFDPIFELLKGRGVRVNEDKDHSALWSAIEAGAVWYAAGVFQGKFSAAISRELRAIGAHFNPVQETFALEQTEIPLALRGLISSSKMAGEALHREVIDTLQAIETNLVSAPSGLSYQKAVDKIAGDLQKQLIRTVSAEDVLASPTPIPPGMEKGMQATLTEDTNTAIKGFTTQQTAELRAKVQQNLAAGGRVDRLAKIIEADYGVAKRRAALIAGQETSQLVEGFREKRYEELGCTQYVWSTSEDEKVRPDHAALNGRRFAFSSPPVVDRASGRRANPGQDFNCRCVPLPVIP